MRERAGTRFNLILRVPVDTVVATLKIFNFFLDKVIHTNSVGLVFHRFHRKRKRSKKIKVNVTYCSITKYFTYYLFNKMIEILC